MTAFVKFEPFIAAVFQKKHNLAVGGDTIKFMLTNTAPNVAWATKSQVTGEIAAGNGYDTGGKPSAITSSAQTAGILVVKFTNITWTASGGSMAQFQYIVAYNDTATNKELIGFFTYAGPVTLANGNTFPITFDATNGLFNAE